MKITVVGAGYVGLVTAACLAEVGNQVLVVDQDQTRVLLLQAGGVPIYEPGLEECVRRNREAGRLRFAHSMAQGVQQAELLFIAVGTPAQEDGSADLQHVLAVAQQIGRHLDGFLVVVNKSTVPVGTAAAVSEAIASALRRRGRSGSPFAVVSNPEFLKEGAAMEDFTRPDRIVIGLPAGAEGERARLLLTRLYEPFNRHHQRTVWMDVCSAELTKYAANAMLATRISFMNEIAALADRVGADIDSVRRGIGADSRIGHSFLYAGTGYGGSCFPKDIRALVQTAASHGLPMRIASAVEAINTEQKQRLLQLVLELMGPDLSGCRFAVWGLAFKPNTSDMREAPSRSVIAGLLARGAQVCAHDPVALDEARRALQHDLESVQLEPGQLRWCERPEQALQQADALLILTEWKCFQNPDFARLRALLRQPLVLDGRNLYDPQLLEQHGLAYLGIGRRNRLGVARLQQARGKQRQQQGVAALL
ncbi:UDP-glucose dehydrogenase family protein [Serpentinimonas maccroryi]|uniref:UDP-glucose dehydrogenase family protein n=1 Tax=Serpentinimonas maccroryi TaxID=1458426 RepID=UPI0020340DEF|nr:UDP-glucose/GDP-mannose dehydrogenase family protein [Serpentinimonas maccroryi]MCM2479726.1 UDP-glucose/GDP-mannose dehydrogenase family protein [Serpentinimonas maccroryi]